MLVPVLVVAGVLGMSWNGLSFTAAAEAAGARRSGAAIGFQQTVLGVGGIVDPDRVRGDRRRRIVARRVPRRRRAARSSGAVLLRPLAEL